MSSQTQPTRPLDEGPTLPSENSGFIQFRRRILSPISIAVIALLVIFGVAGYGLGMAAGKQATNTTNTNGSGSSMDMGGSTTNASPYPKATTNAGNQLAKFTTDPDGAKHFTFTAMNVQWQVVKDHWVNAYTLDGMVPGPTIHVTAGDHVRITINNKLDEATTIHWHGLMVPASQDGVPGIGQDPIKPGTAFTYDYTIHADQYGTDVYHSHYDDVKQVGEGLYGAYIIDPKPGTPSAANEPKVQHDYLQIIGEMSGWFVINGHAFPDTEVWHVKHGDQVRVRIINLGELIHPMHLHAHNFSVIARDGSNQPSPDLLNTVVMAPGETADLLFTAWANPGDVYPFHCHVLTHVMNPGQSMTEMGGLITLLVYDK